MNSLILERPYAPMTSMSALSVRARSDQLEADRRRAAEEKAAAERKREREIRQQSEGW